MFDYQYIKYHYSGTQDRNLDLNSTISCMSHVILEASIAKIDWLQGGVFEKFKIQIKDD